eukprot:Pompholyxophrys_punicea_v1_NODE_937_length_1117_cov_5.883239.p1 type:complete len:114 gc:universal NODE_937_length_1117_cov_5.883239:967-626(-)
MLLSLFLRINVSSLLFIYCPPCLPPLYLLSSHGTRCKVAKKGIIKVILKAPQLFLTRIIWHNIFHCENSGRFSCVKEPSLFNFFVRLFTTFFRGHAYGDSVKLQPLDNQPSMN